MTSKGIRCCDCGNALTVKKEFVGTCAAMVPWITGEWELEITDTKSLEVHDCNCFVPFNGPEVDDA